MYYYFILYFFFGVMAGLIALVYFMGPIARKIGYGHMFNKFVALFPRLDRSFEVRLLKKNVKGRVFLKKLGIYSINPKKVYIGGGKCRTGIFPEGSGTNFTPEDASLAERKVKGEKNPSIKTKGENGAIENVSYNDLIESVKSIMGPDALADMVMNARGAWSPVEPEKGKMMTTLKVAGIGVVILMLLAGFYIAKTMGWI